MTMKLLTISICCALPMAAMGFTSHPLRSSRHIVISSSSPSTTTTTTSRSSEPSELYATIFEPPTETTNDIRDRSSPPRINTIDTSESTPRQIFPFEFWAYNSAGIQRADGFQLSTAVAGVGVNKRDTNVYATTAADIAAETPILYVPEHLILSSSKAMGELRTPDMIQNAERVFLSQLNLNHNSNNNSDDAAKINDDALKKYYLMLKLIYEIQNGEYSPWYAYLNSLPRYFSNAIAMTPFCLQCLPPWMRKLVEKERTAFQKFILGGVKHSIEQVPFLNEESKAKCMGGSLAVWAYQIVMTRAFDDIQNDDLKLVPMGDYFNHGYYINDAVEIQPYYDESGNYYAYSTKDIAAGSPLRMSYEKEEGVINPSGLLAKYGFLEEDCPGNFCKIMVDEVNSEMRELGYDHSRMIFYNNGQVSDEVWDILLYLHLQSTKNNPDLQTLLTSHRTQDYPSKQLLHQQYYPYTSQMLLTHIDNFLEEIDKLTVKANTVAGHAVYIQNEHPRLPLIMKHNELVKDIFLKVRSLYEINYEEQGMDWREATKPTTRVKIMECDDVECAMSECILDEVSEEWMCEGGLGYDEDGNERAVSKTIVEAL